MKRHSLFIATLAFAVCIGVPAAFAQHGGGRPSGAGGGAAGGGSGMGAAGGAGTGSSMGRSAGRGDTRGNGSMGGANMGSESVSHSSPTTLLSTNTHLAETLQSRLGSMLPSGTSLTDAASGFKNLGEFVAAVHVSNNLGIPFEDLKGKMTSGDNLGKAIKELKPEANSKSEAKKAKKQAKADIEESKS